MRKVGGNFARTCYAPWSMGLEHTPGTLDRYDLATAWHADHFVQLAEDCGMFPVIAMDHHGMFTVNDPAWRGGGQFLDPEFALCGGKRRTLCGSQ